MKTTFVQPGTAYLRPRRLQLLRMLPMSRTYPHLEIERRPNVCCVRLRSHRIAESEIHTVVEELVALSRWEGFRNLVLSLGPNPPECLYSVFLAKLCWARRILGEEGRSLVLCQVDPMVRTIFEACKLDEQFRFAEDFDEAVAALAR
jgi:hypothetical protein